MTETIQVQKQKKRRRRSRRSKVITRPNILDECSGALVGGLHVFILILGPKGKGKSSLALQFMHRIFNRYVLVGDVWDKVFENLHFTPQQFYHAYKELKDKIDSALEEIGLSPDVLYLDPNKDWNQIKILVRAIAREKVAYFTEIRERYRLPVMVLDDIGASMNRQDQKIYSSSFYSNLFGDLTLIRPYVAVMIATAPTVNDVPRAVLDHVTDIIDCQEQGKGIHQKKRQYIRFKGSKVSGYYKLAEGDTVKWDPLSDEEYAYYEILRHLVGRAKTQGGLDALEYEEEARYG